MRGHRRKRAPRLTKAPPASAKIVTTDLLYCLRYKRRAYVLATEVKYNRCRSDVLALSNHKIYEFEVKVSLSDLKKDFEKTMSVGYRSTRRTVTKHSLYTNRGDTAMFVPHYFIFVVPEKLVAAALELCADHPRYGVWCWAPLTEDKMRVMQAAKPLNVDPLNTKVVGSIMKRATSELVQVRMKLYTPDSVVPEDLEDEED